MNQFWFEKEHVLNYGLSYLLDYERGIARGVITDDKPAYVPKKDFLTFMMLAIFFGIFGLDRMYLGGNFVYQGWTKFLTCFILIGFIWVFHDMFYVLFQPGVVLDDGYPVPLPFNAVYSQFTGWDSPSAKYVGDLFQVTLDPGQKQALSEAESGSEGVKSPLAAAAAFASAKGKLPGSLGKLGGLAGGLAGGLGKVVQRGGGEVGADYGLATRAAFTAVLLGLGSLVGYSVIKAAKT